MRIYRQFALGLVIVCATLILGCVTDQTIKGSHPGPLGKSPASQFSRVKAGLSAQASKLADLAKPKVRVVGAADPVSLSSKVPKIGADLYVAHARSFEAMDNTSEAASQYAKALDIDPDYLDGLLGYAHLLDRNEKKTEATLYYERAVKAHPLSARAVNDLALCYARRGMDQRALIALRRAVELSPKKKLYRNNIAALLIDRGEEQKALYHLGAVYDRATAHYNVAFLLNKHGSSQQALHHFQEAARISPGMTAAHSWIANLSRRRPSEVAHRQISGRPPTADRRNDGSPRAARWEMSPRGQGQILQNRALEHRVEVAHLVPPTVRPTVTPNMERESSQQPKTPIVNPTRTRSFPTPATPIRLPSTVRPVTYSGDDNRETPPLPNSSGLRLSSRDDRLDDLFPENAPSPF